MSRRVYGQLLAGIGSLTALLGYFVLPFISAFIVSVTAYQVLTFPTSLLNAAASSFPTGIFTLAAVLLCIGIGAVCALALPLVPRGPGFARGLFGFSATTAGIIGLVLLILFVLPNGSAMQDFFSQGIYRIYGAGLYAMLLGLALVTWGGALVVSTDD